MTPLLHSIVVSAAADAGCTLEQMLGPQREHVPARYQAMRRAYEAGYSTTQIGRALNRDHTTVLYAIGRLKRLPQDMRAAG